MPKKMPRRLVALSASAVAAIYAVGLLSSRQDAEVLAGASTGADAAVAATPSSTVTTNGMNPTSTPLVVVGASASAVATSSASPTPAATLTAAATATALPFATSAPAATPTALTATAVNSSTYANGSYTATGTSRFGNVSVSVTISGDKIANVQITKVTTSFPVSRIASLPAQVIQHQTASVNTVTGATYSSQAFKQAVQQTLAQAQAATTTVVSG